jgi:hypothetical protein
MHTSHDRERIRRYRETLGHAWRHTGDAHGWPVKLNAAIHLFVREFGEEFLADLAWLEAQGRTLDELAKPFYNPARLYRIIDSIVYSMRRNRYPMSEQRAAVLKLLTMVKSLKSGSEFNEDGRNVIFAPDHARAVAAAKLRPIRSVEESQLIHRFCAAMWTYTEAIFFRAHDVTQEMHGPYDVGAPDQRFLVKEYLNLRPDEIWPDMPLLPCKSIKVYQQYSTAVRIRIDALNHVYHEGGSLVPNLSAWGVEVEGEPIELDDVSGYLRPVAQAITTISRRIEALDWHERVAKYADIFWFRKKPLSDQRGRPWTVPADVRDTIGRGTEYEPRRASLSNEASERLALLTI